LSRFTGDWIAFGGKVFFVVMRDTAIIYRSFFEAIRELPKESQAEIWEAVCEYAFNFNEVELSGLAKSIFTLIKPQLEANIKRYQNGLVPKNKGKISETEAKDKRNGSETESNKNKNKNKKEKENIDFSPFIDFPEYWERWKAFRKKIHKADYFDEGTEKRAFNDLLRASNNSQVDAIQIIENSIQNNWKGFFPLKNKFLGLPHEGNPMVGSIGFKAVYQKTNGTFYSLNEKMQKVEERKFKP